MSDPDWHPDPEDGLRGDRLLSEALAPHVPEDGHPTDAGVYVLRCCSPGDLHAHAQRWRKAGYETAHPSDIDDLAASTHLLYVGSSRNVRRRIADHLSGDRRQASFLTVYPPFDVALVEWCAAARRFIAERKVADRLADRHPEWAVWCDGVVR